MRRSSGYGDYEAPKSLRERLINDGYRDAVEPVFFEPSKDTVTPIEEQFAKLTAKWLAVANQAYSKRSGCKGIWYAQDYVQKYGNSSTINTSINYMANPKYWDIGIRGRFQENGSNSYTPSEMLNAFFQGPTMGECASVLQACQYRALEELIGTEAFNHHFGKSLTPFMITPILFNPIYSVNSEIALADKGIETRNSGNPLCHLFSDRTVDMIRGISSSITLTDEDIKPGYVIYLKGVDKYQQKHLEGVDSGSNLLCVGKNLKGENLYYRFNPDMFDKPKTYKELTKALIDGYNKGQSFYTRDRIERFGSDSNHQHYVVAKKAESLASDKVGYDYPIVGIQHAISINPMKLKYFITERAKSHSLPWHSEPEQTFPLLAFNGSVPNLVF